MSKKGKGTIRPIPRNKLLAAISEGLRGTREGLDYVPLPEAVGGGLGSLLLGESPEEVSEWSYGFSPFKERPGASVIPIEVRPGREQRLMDTALLPAAEAYGVAKLAAKRLKKGIEKAVSGPVEQGRREFLSKAGQAAAGVAATAAVAPDLVRTVTKTAAKTASPNQFLSAMKAVDGQISKNVNTALAKLSQSEYETLAKRLVGEGFEEGDVGGMSIGENAVRNHLRERFEKQAYDKLKKDPQFKEYSDFIKPFGDIEFQNKIKKAAGGMIENTTHDRKLI